MMPLESELLNLHTKQYHNMPLSGVLGKELHSRSFKQIVESYKTCATPTGLVILSMTGSVSGVQLSEANMYILYM